MDIHGRVQYGPPKTNEVRDVVPPAFLRDELTPWLAGKGLDDLLFTAPEGGPLRYANFRSRVFNPAARRAGLELTPHDLRHTAASLPIQSGANVKAVQRMMLGHATAAMTLDTYAGLFDSDLRVSQIEWIGQFPKRVRIICGLATPRRVSQRWDPSTQTRSDLLFC